jgi:hypothetical protein
MEFLGYFLEGKLTMMVLVRRLLLERRKRHGIDAVLEMMGYGMVGYRPMPLLAA